MLMGCVGALFYGTLALILTAFVYGIGAIPGAICGGLYGIFASRRTPLRESVVLFVGCVGSSILLLRLGNRVELGAALDHSDCRFGWPRNRHFASHGGSSARPSALSSGCSNIERVFSPGSHRSSRPLDLRACGLRADRTAYGIMKGPKLTEDTTTPLLMSTTATRTRLAIALLTALSIVGTSRAQTPGTTTPPLTVPAPMPPTQSPLTQPAPVPPAITPPTPVPPGVHSPFNPPASPLPIVSPVAAPETAAPPAALDNAPLPDAGKYAIEGDAASLSVFAVSTDAQELFTALADKANLRVVIDDTVSRRLTVNITHTPARQVIDEIVSAYGLSAADVDGVTMISEGIPRSPSSYLLSDITSIPTKYVNAANARNLLPVFLQDYVKVNSEQNAVVLSAPTEVLTKFREDIAQFDIPASQIQVDLLLVDLTDTNVDQLGLTLTYQNGGQGPSIDPGAGNIAYNAVTSLPNLFLANLQALQQSGKAPRPRQPPHRHRFRTTRFHLRRSAALRRHAHRPRQRWRRPAQLH